MKTTNKTTYRRASKAGLTLIELLVVLVILTGLGSLLLPTINDALTRTHLATCSASFQDVHTMAQRALFDGGGIGNNLETGVFNTSGESVNGASFVGTLTQAEVTALNNIGLTTVINHGDPTAAGYDPTFEIGGVAETLDTATEVLRFTGADTLGLYLPGATADDAYVVLMIGRDWTGLGDVAAEPPVHFGDDPNATPNKVHSRFGLVFQVSSDADGSITDLGDDGVAGTGDDTLGAGGVETAQFITVAYTLDGEGLETRDEHTAVYWNEVVEGS